jgi:hypothetical protein
VKIEEVEVAEQVDAAAPVHVDAVAIDPDEPDIVEAEPEPEPAAAAKEPEKKNGMRLFTDVLKTLKG